MGRHIGDVVCAIIEHEGRFLVARRGAGRHLAMKWEFPGGKVEAGETHEAALERELQEELGVRVDIVGRLTPVEYDYPDVSLRLVPFRCRLVAGTPEAREHDELRWIDICQVSEYDFPEADAPVLDEYRRAIPGNDGCVRILP